ncbi:DUF2927 domain-containing protein [Aestuariispira insulae]|uniref:Dual-action HEIGH metallo-peptidase n=1 Tax=Aestuariispira insulae TaxID=1461337 RepID=A0A3D9HX93_9PROT|nr:DUF2927 domain-containing protein [Aestuariispira insulae]RED54039.1 hypothetical protein DFP90_101840 [Aestuariispira insulae]
MRVISLIVSCLLLVSCNSPEEVNQRLVQAFDDLVFFVAPDRQGAEVRQWNPYLVRWEGEVRYFVQVEGSPEPGMLEQIDRAMARVGAVAGRKVSRAEKLTETNITFTLNATDRDYRINGAERASCYANIDEIFKPGNQSEDGGKLKKASIYLPGMRPRVMTACLEHEILHVFGFWGHTQRIRSTMSSFVSENEMTKWDEMLLKALYSPNLEPGMKREEALKRAEQELLLILAAS